jgi:hypothetical protein
MYLKELIMVKELFLSTMKSTTHTLEEAQKILDELNKLASNRPNDEY